ncbi:MAG: hypothetical protein MN733_22215 [Nitrososphaera sp.]|nr:hypothetical protein [Nitrososphaera sp.]
MKRLMFAALLLIAACEDTMRPPNGLPRSVVILSPTMGDICTIKNVIKIVTTDHNYLALFTIDGAGNETALVEFRNSQWRWE